MLRWQWTLALVVLLSASLFVTACGGGGDDDDDGGGGDDDTTDDDTTDDDVDDDTTDDDTVFEIDFEDYSVGALGAPWNVLSSGASTHEVAMLTKDGSGKALLQNGGNAEQVDGYALAQYQFADINGDCTISFDVKPVDNTTDWGFRVLQNYSGYAFTESQIVVENGAVSAFNAATFETTSCDATLTGGDWTNVALVFDFAGGTYSVEIDGTPTDCADFSMIYGDGTPLGFVQFIDFSDAGFIGDFQVDNILGEDTTPSTLFSVDFESYSVGPLGSPWVTAFGGGGAANIVSLVAGDGAGKVLEIDGVDSAAPDYILSTYQFPDVADDLDVSFDVMLVDSDAEFGFRTFQNYGGYAYTETQLVLADEILQAFDYNASAFVDCGDLAAGGWHNVLVHHDFTGTYSVLIDGVDTDCDGMGMAWGDGTPFGFISVIDWSDLDYGGEVWFDNFLGVIPE